MRAPLFGDAPGGERPSRGNRDSSSRHGSDSSGWLSGTATRNTALVSCAFLLMLAAMGQMGTEREWNSGLREMVRSRIEAAGLASAVRQVQTLEEISDGALVVAFLLAVASTFAVGWLVATAPNKDSPQFRTTLPVDDVPLGFVDEIDDREPYGRT